MAFGPETGVLVGSLNSYYVTNGATDLATLTPSPSGFLTAGDIIWNGAPANGAPPFWVVLTGGATPTFAAGTALGGGLNATLALTAANIIAMNGAPISVIAAPGAGKVILVTEILFEMTTTATVFTGGGAVSLVYTGGSTAVHAGSVPASVVTAAAGTSNTMLGPAVATNGTTVPANTGVSITNATAAFAAGTGTAKVQVWYRVVTL